MPIVYHQNHLSPWINQNHGGVHHAKPIDRHPDKESTNCVFHLWLYHLPDTTYPISIIYLVYRDKYP